MSVLINEIRKNFYLDSVALMRFSAEITAQPGVEEAVMMIGTPANLDIMRSADLLAENGSDATPNDLLIAVRADSSGNANRALAQAERSLAGSRKPGASSTEQVYSLQSARQQLPDANLALISTPGLFVESEARNALDNDLNVMIFSDNVSIEAELALKQMADEKGLLVMGPDCGSAIIGNTPLAFANVVPDGNIGVIAASGTGLQEFTVLAARLGCGTRHAIGVGGRDLQDQIGAISTLRAIDLLLADDSIEQLVVIGKPPGPQSAERVFNKLSTAGKPVVACIFGQFDRPASDNIRWASNLRQAAELATGQQLQQTRSHNASQITDGISAPRRDIVGLYSGGTLCTEALQCLQAGGRSIHSNLSGDPVPNAGHRLIDLGADEFTLGKPHPMIDPAVRNEHLEKTLADPRVALVLLDVVLGYGAHTDPASSISAVLNQQDGPGPLVLAYICGVDDDPQNFQQQSQCLQDCGVLLCDSNFDMAQLASEIADQL